MWPNQFEEKKMNSLEEKVAFVTGAARGIGDGTAELEVFMKIIFDWRHRKIGALVQKGIGGCWLARDSQGRAQIRRFSSRDREPRKCQEALSSRRLADSQGHCSRPSRICSAFELTAEKRAFSLGSKLLRVRSIWFRRGDPVHQRKRILRTFVSGILNDDPIFAGVAASTVSGALEAFVRAAAIELPKGLRINVVSPTDAKRIRISICPVLYRHDSGRRMKVDKPTNALSWGAHRPRLQS